MKTRRVRLHLETLERRELLSFGNGGIALFQVPTNVSTFTSASGSRAFAGVIQPADGKIVAVGDSTSSVVANTAIGRLNPAGGLDATFNGQGTSWTSFDGYGNGSRATVAVVQPDGRILTGGPAITYSTGWTVAFALARWNTNGTLDTTFGDLAKKSGTARTGKVATVIGTRTSDRNDIVESLVLQADGKILALGGENIPGYSGAGSSNSAVAMARYNANGTLDTTFGTGGKVLVHVTVGTGNRAPVFYPNQGVQLSDGSILLVGSTWNVAASTNPPAPAIPPRWLWPTSRRAGSSIRPSAPAAS